MKNICKYFLFLFSFYFVNYSLAQTPLFKNLKEGLSSSEVYDCISDNLGYILFATENGICQYNGYTFKTYTVLDGLSDNTIVEFFRDSKGRIWYRPLIGMPGYFYNNKIYNISNDSLNYTINSICEDLNGNIYFGTLNGYLKVSNNSNLVKYLTFNKDFKYNKHLFYLSGVDKRGFIWGYQYDRQILIRNDSTKIFYKKGFYGMYNHTLPRILDFKIYRKFIEYNSIDINILKFSNYYKKIDYIYSLLRDEILTFVIEDSDHKIWVGTYNNGLYLFENNFLLSDKYIKHYFNNLSISSIFEDREGNYWVTSIGNGVFFISSQKYLTYTTKFGLSENNILSMSLDKNGGLWLGQNNGFVNRLFNDSIFIYNFNEKFKFKYRTTAILGHSNGSVWFGTDKSIFIRSKDQFSRILFSKSPGRDAVKCLSESNDGSVFVGTNLTIFKTDGKKFEDLDPKLSILPCRVTALASSHDSSLWIGSEKGLFKYYKDSLYPINSDNSKFKRISRIKLTKNAVYFTTKNFGFFRVSANKILNINEKNGLSSNICLSFVNQGDSIFWIATNKGLNKVVLFKNGKKCIEVSQLNFDNGLNSNEIHDIHKKGDTLWLATSSGLSFFTEKSLNDNTAFLPPIYLTSLKINDRDTTLLKKYDLKYNTNNIKVDFVGLSFKSNGQIKYRYKMVGIDANWNYTTFTTLQYPSLPPGDYTLMVYAIGIDNTESNPPLVIKFSIFPPFYTTWWFILLSIVLFVFILLSVFFWRLKVFQKREKETIKFNRMMNEIELKALRSQMNPHFIFNCMNSIQGFIIKNDAEVAHSYLSKFSRLMRNVLENSKNATITLEQEIATLKLYMDLEILRFDNKFNYEFIIDSKIESNFIEIPSMLIQPYIENAIWHGLLHKNSSGEILVKFDLISDSLLRCIIEDNGIGRVESAKLKSLHINKHKSLGMLITKERLEIINSSQKNNLGLHIFDLYDDNGNPTGTKVEIIIPTS